MEARRLDFYWLALIVGTAVTWALGESGAAGPAAVLGILSIAAVKGIWIAREFMGLRRIKVLWPGLVIGWLLAVLALIALAYMKGST
ncbi:MAG: cytochrome C oxidase subunit IV family protein [Rhodocyclaceae bacterium]|nr:cytochrome C oxidase subunit IV family protein [Rhodocyclaceae bacterium]